MQKLKSDSIYIADPFFDKKNFYEYKKNFKKYNLIFNKSKKTLNTNDLKKIFLKHPSIIGIIAGLEVYNFKTLYHQKNLKFISRVGVGIDSLDLDYLKKKNIKILKLSNELTYCVAEFFLTLILISLRNVIPNYELLKKKNLETYYRKQFKRKKK